MSQFGSLRAPGEPNLTPTVDPVVATPVGAVAAGAVTAPATVIYVHQSASPTFSYASWLSRVAAYFIDAIVLAVIIVVLGGGAAALSGSGAGVILGFVGAFLYCPLMHASRAGQTLGKKAMGIALRGTNGEQVDLIRAFMRTFVSWLFLAIPILALFDNLAPLFDSERRAIHDKAVGTIVVEATG